MVQHPSKMQRLVPFSERTRTRPHHGHRAKRRRMSVQEFVRRRYFDDEAQEDVEEIDE